MLRYKKLFGLCVLLVALSALIIPQPGNRFGWPLRWVEYYGKEPIAVSADLFKPGNLQHLFFDLWNLVLGALLLYFTLILLHKLLSRMMGKTDGRIQG